MSFSPFDISKGASAALRGTVQNASAALVERTTAPIRSTINTAINTAEATIQKVGSTIQAVGSAIPVASGIGRAKAATGQPSAPDTSDLRVRLRALPGRDKDVYGDGILASLRETNGMLFPYTPTIAYSQDVDYSSVDLVHYIGDVNAYKRTPGVTLTVSGKFTAQNQREAEYLATCLHFLRTVKQMHFGKSDPKAGLPPPVLMFEGYGSLMFGLKDTGVRVIVKNFSFTLDDTVDSVTVRLPGGFVARVPMLTTINVTIATQNTPAQMRNFDLEKFRSGALLARGGYL